MLARCHKVKGVMNGYLLSQVCQDSGAFKDGKVVILMVDQAGHSAVWVDLGDVFGILDGAFALAKCKRNTVIVQTEVFESHRHLHRVGTGAYRYLLASSRSIGEEALPA